MTDATIIHGDCFSVLPTLATASVDLIFCDLPYGAIKQDWDVKVCLERLWPLINNVRKKVSTVIFTATFPFAFDVLATGRSLFKHDLIWHKNTCGSFQNAKYRPLAFHENIFVFGKDIKYRPQMTLLDKPYTCTASDKRSNQANLKRIRRTYTHAHPQSVLKFGAKGRSGLHATQKPIDLLRWLIRSYSDPGDTVLEPTAGSGTTSVAAILEGRHSVSIEKDVEIYMNARERILVHQDSLRRHTGRNPAQRPVGVPP